MKRFNKSKAPAAAIYPAAGAILVLALLLSGAPGALQATAGSQENVFLPLVLNKPSLSEVGHLLITEVLYDPDDDQGSVEWIEILNPTGEVIDLEPYKIGDEETLGENEGMYQFPAGAAIGVGQTIVIAKHGDDFESAYGFKPDYELSNTGTEVPDMLRYAAWAGGSVNLTNTGDEVLLLDLFDDLVDAVSWGSSDWAFAPGVPDVVKGHSIERIPAHADSDTAEDWVDQAAPSPGSVDLTPPTPTPTVGPTATPTAGGVLISEVLYDSNDSEPASEWIEIQNVSGGPLDISGFKIGDEETKLGSEGMYQFPAGSVIPGGAAAVIANEASTFLSLYGFKPDFEIHDTDPDVPDLEKYTPWASGTISLSNTGDEVLLLGLSDQLVDSVSWGSSSWAFDPPVEDVPNGHSIERFPTGVDTDTAADWRDQEIPDPGDF